MDEVGAVVVLELQDGGQAHPATTDTTLSSGECGKTDTKNGNGAIKKKRRRGKSKRKKITKPFVKLSAWQERRKNKSRLKRVENRSSKMLSLTKTRAPFNNNQFLMEIHKPEPDKNAEGRTRDSSFSMDSDENYFFSLPEDEEDFLTKEFSSVYEDAQCERLDNMSKQELVQEYLLLEAKYEGLSKRLRYREPERTNEDDLRRRLQEQETIISELRLANEKLRQQQECSSSSADSESDSCSTSSLSSSSSISCHEMENESVVTEGHLTNGNLSPDQSLSNSSTIVNGEHSTEQMVTNAVIVNGDISH